VREGATHGSPRVYADLRRRRVCGRLMLAATLSGCEKRDKDKTRIRVQGRPRPRRSGRRQLTAEAPNQLWRSDISPDMRGETLPRLGHRLVQPQGRRRLDARLYAGQARHRGARDGGYPPPTNGRTRPALRPGLPPRLARVRLALPAGRDRPVDRLQGRLLRHSQPGARGYERDGSAAARRWQGRRTVREPLRRDRSRLLRRTGRVRGAPAKGSDQVKSLSLPRPRRGTRPGRARGRAGARRAGADGRMKVKSLDALGLLCQSAGGCG
jgi:hypothetical protein